MPSRLPHLQFVWNPRSPARYWFATSNRFLSNGQLQQYRISFLELFRNFFLLPKICTVSIGFDIAAESDTSQCRSSMRKRSGLQSLSPSTLNLCA
jgi:hypothetical protein